MSDSPLRSLSSQDRFLVGCLLRNDYKSLINTLVLKEVLNTFSDFVRKKNDYSEVSS